VSNFGTIILPNANLGAFGDLEVMQMTPLLQWSFATGLRDQLGTATVLNSATVDSNGGRIRLQTGTNAAGSAVYASAKPGSYRPGQGMTWRGTPFWAGSAASSRQYQGVGNAIDGYMFGYNGAAFGILHRINSSDSGFVAQTAWNGDKCDGAGASAFNWDKTKGVPCMIKYPYLGHGNVRFYVLDPLTSGWILCHTVRYANTSATPQMTNPNLQLYAEAVNAGNTTNLISYLTCASLMLDGPREYLGAQFATDNGKTGFTTQLNILTLKNCTSINGVANRGLARLRSLSFAYDGGNGRSTLRLIKNTALGGGGVTYAAISGTVTDTNVATTLTAAQSTMSVDVAGTTITGGTVLFNSCCSRNTGMQIDLVPYNLFIAPGETMTFALTNTVSGDGTVAVNWQEDTQ
jgi:hypothetical protein